jgi:hypothetical protein
MSSFFIAGGWAMYPTAIFGFLLIAACVLHMLRPEPKRARLALTLGIVTFASGLLGTFVGMCTSAHFIPQVPKAEQLEILALGCEESLHNVVLALVLVVLGGLLASVGALRQANGSATPSARAA